MLNLEDIFGRNIGNKNFYLDFCNKLIKARGENKTLYQFNIFKFGIFKKFNEFNN